MYLTGTSGVARALFGTQTGYLFKEPLNCKYERFIIYKPYKFKCKLYYHSRIKEMLWLDEWSGYSAWLLFLLQCLICNAAQMFRFITFIYFQFMLNFTQNHSTLFHPVTDIWGMNGIWVFYINITVANIRNSKITLVTHFVPSLHYKVKSLFNVWWQFFGGISTALVRIELNCILYCCTRFPPKSITFAFLPVVSTQVQQKRHN